MWLNIKKIERKRERKKERKKERNKERKKERKKERRKERKEKKERKENLFVRFLEELGCPGPSLERFSHGHLISKVRLASSIHVFPG
jgi:hypothetical protein